MNVCDEAILYNKLQIKKLTMQTSQHKKQCIFINRLPIPY